MVARAIPYDKRPQIQPQDEYWEYDTQFLNGGKVFLPIVRKGQDKNKFIDSFHNKEIKIHGDIELSPKLD